MVMNSGSNEPELTPPDVTNAQAAKEGPNVWMAVSGAVMAIGAFLPWITLGIISIPGTRGDGVFLVVGGLIVGALGVLKKRTTAIKVGAIVVSVLAGLIVLNTGSNLADLIAEAEPTLLGSPSWGTGLLLSGAGCLSGLLSAFAD